MIPNLQPYPAYKDSGVPWLGEVPVGWEVRRLGQIGSFFKGNGGNKEDEKPSGVPCVRYGDLYTTHTYFIRSSRSFVSSDKAVHYTPIEFGDVLFAASGETIDEIGKSAVNLMRSEACCGGDVILFRPGRRVEAQYMGYATDCRPATAQKAAMGRGITVKHVYGDQLKHLTIPLPPLPEQTAIVRFLDWADRRIRRVIRARQKRIKLLEEYKQALIHRAVTGRIDVRTGRPYSAYKDSGVEWLGKVPVGWEARRLKTLVVRVDQGVSPQAENYLVQGDEWGVLKAGCVNRGRFREEQHKRLPSGFPVDDALVVKVGDILVSRASGSPELVGSTGRVRSLNTKLILSDKTFRPVFRPLVSVDFMLMAMNSRLYRQQVETAISGAEGLANNLPLSSLRSFVFLVPPLEEALFMATTLLKLTEQVENAVGVAQDQIHLLQELRTRLIADVVTGKLDVREAAARLPEEGPELEEAELLQDEVVEGEDDGAFEEELEEAAS